jgi:hypothetical protein
MAKALLAGGSTSAMVMGYEEVLLTFDDQNESPWWLRTATNFLLDLQQTRDFRRERLRLFEQHLGGLIVVLNPSSRQR